MTEHSEIFEQLRNIIAEETGNDPASITPDSDLIEDLGMVIEHDLPPVVKRINIEFDVALNAKVLVLTAETVNDLLTYIIEEIELG